MICIKKSKLIHDPTILEQSRTVQAAKGLLAELQFRDTVSPKKRKMIPTTTPGDENGDDTKNDTEPPFLWGGLSVGPVWKSRLLEAGYTKPNPIQKAAFTPITKGGKYNSNVILASPTGSGKSLAYSLPLIAGGKKLQGMIWIVTSTVELALPSQRVAETDPCWYCRRRRVRKAETRMTMTTFRYYPQSLITTTTKTRHPSWQERPDGFKN